jgi:hypothetical protein
MATLTQHIQQLSPNQREWFEERAGIMEFDGRMPREQAERLALKEVAGIELPPPAVNRRSAW